MGTRLEIPRYRGLWEARCQVEGCPHTVTVAGKWDIFQRTPSFYRLGLPSGWIHLDRVANRPPQGVPHPRGILCPDHAPAWIEYVARAREWDAEHRPIRKARHQAKGLWETLARIFKGNPPEEIRLPDPPPPVPPYEAP